MTYNQVQSFQINDYANYYVDIKITGYRALYSKSIAGRGVATLISWLGTAGPVDCFNESVSDCYIRVYRSFWQGTPALCCCMITPPFLQIRAWSSEKGEPQPSQLEGTFNRGFQ